MPGFLDNDNYVLMLDSLAQQYHKRPSELLEIEDGLTALDFDFSIMAKANMLRAEKQSDNSINLSSGKSSKLESQIRNVQNMQRKAAM